MRLVDLLDAAKDRMAGELQQRADEGKTPLRGEDLQAAAKVIGYGAVKYFDLKQHPSSNYIFSYDRMLDTKVRVVDVLLLNELFVVETEREEAIS